METLMLNLIISMIELVLKYIITILALSLAYPFKDHYLRGWLKKLAY